MGMYIFINQFDRENYTEISDNAELNELFQEARKYDNSILIMRQDIFKRHFWKPDTVNINYQVYHETHPNEDPYQAQYQFLGSGSEQTVNAYLCGIINGALAVKNK